MAIVQKEYVCFNYVLNKDNLHTRPIFLPVWLMNAPMKYTKIIKFLGCTANVIDSIWNYVREVAKSVKLMSNLTKNTLLNEFVGMTNNYECVKEFDITHKNIRELT
jgi:hypothetical protein